MRIDVALVDDAPLGVDTPADLERAARPARAVRRPRHERPTQSIAFQGEPGANSHMACRDRLSRPEPAALRHLRGRLRRGAATARPSSP